MSAAGSAPRLLVTGASGFLGGRVIHRARRRGLALRALSRRATNAWAGDAGVEAIAADLSAPDAEAALRGALDGVDAVIHAAGAMQGGDEAHARDTIAPTRALIAAIAACATPPRLVLVSSIAIYGCAAMPAWSTLDETAPLEPDPGLRDAYCRAKLAQEALAVRAAQKLGLQLRVMRPGAIFGPGRLWSARLGVAKGPLLLRPDGGAILPAIHVEHCAEALLLAAATPLTQSDIPIPEGDGRFEAINVVDDDPPTRARWLAALAAAGKTPKWVLPMPLRPMRAASKALSFAPGLAARAPGLLREPTLAARFRPLRYANARLRDRLGWRPERDFDAAMRDSLTPGGTAG